jgi:hypothetical protein
MIIDSFIFNKHCYMKVRSLSLLLQDEIFLWSIQSIAVKHGYGLDIVFSTGTVFVV